MAKHRPTEFDVAFNTIARRLAALTVICAAMWLAAQIPELPLIGTALRGHADPDDRLIERIGSPAVVYDPRAYDILECDTPPCNALGDDSLDYDVRIEVLDSGLIEGRGLAYDADGGRLIVADAWEPLYGYWPTETSARPERLPWIRICPGGECHDVDHRGLAFDRDPSDPEQSRIVVTDFHQHRLSLRRPNGEFEGSIGGRGLIDGVTDVTLAEPHAYFVSATGEGAGPANPDQKPRGAVYHVTRDDATPIVTGLQRPIGLAFSPCDPEHPRLYVADSTPGALTLYFFTQDTHGDWQRAGVLATLPADRSAPPAPLSGMAVVRCRTAKDATGADSNGALFVAGPGGLYLFHPDGALLAKFVLSERVTALAWDEWIAKNHPPSEPEIHQLYMTVGHRIARLHTIAGPEPIETRRPRHTPAATTPVEVNAPPTPPAPVSGERPGGSKTPPDPKTPPIEKPNEPR
jgi:hypothetical protein